MITFGAPTLLAANAWGMYLLGVAMPLAQPAPFSHEHHVAGLRIDCRY